MSNMNTIRMTSQQYSELRQTLLSSENETAVFLVSGTFRNDEGIHFVVRDVITLAEKDYDHRSGYHIQVSPIFFNKVINIAEANGITIIQCHSHPFSENKLGYSYTDNYGESRSAKTILDCLGTPMGSLLFGPNQVIGRVWLSPNKKPETIDQLRIVGRRLKIKEIGRKNKTRKIDIMIYDRQILGISLKGQQLLSQLKIGIVGLGGTGSAVAEQLVRAGVTNYKIIDDDIFEPSNKTRLYGSYASDNNQYKTKIVKRNIQRIQPSATVTEIRKKITTEQDLEELLSCDVVFSCTDKHIPRSLLSNFVYQYFIPVIDVGVGIDVENETIVGANVRATLIGPGLPCLYCIGIVDPEVILAESLPLEERKTRLQEGYIVGLDDDVPSVIEATTQAASMGILLLKNLLFGIINTQANTLALDLTTFQSSRLAASVKPDCVCLFRKGKGSKQGVVGGE